MEIKGIIHCLFEQSGVFKTEFQKLGYTAIDYDIENNYGETDVIINLFEEIEKSWENKPSIFDTFTSVDLILAFFPCTYFTSVSQIAFSLNDTRYKNLDRKSVFEKMLEKNDLRSSYYATLLKFVYVCLNRNLRMILENPFAMQTYLRVFLKPPTIIDYNRMTRGDYMIKPTGYWFWNCEPTHLVTLQMDKKRIKPNDITDKGIKGSLGLARSLISPDYARNFICDFILGIRQKGTILDMFEETEDDLPW